MEELTIKKIAVAILGATGLVGQWFAHLLRDHPWFNPSVIAASQRSTRKKYIEAVNWVLGSAIPDYVRDLEVVDPTPAAIAGVDDVDLVFSALPPEIAITVEPEFAKAGYAISSNASAFRLDPYVPLLVPEINPEHVKLIEVQKQRRDWSGFIVTNPNCSTAILSLSLAPLHRAFGLRRVIVSTMQAISGAGLEGLFALNIQDNVIPFIAREEEKIQTETLKILGLYQNEAVKPADFRITASCHRVLVSDGHTEAVFVETERKCDLEEVKNVLNNFRGKPQQLSLPSAPKRPVVVLDAKDRPQPKLDRFTGNGMSSVVGRIRSDESVANGLKYIVHGHNLVRGAAGSSILNAELLFKLGKVPK